MKYIVILGDGMADEPIAALGGKTPLECAKTPIMDELASKGRMGLVKTVPECMKPGSDVANLAVLGYDPAANYSGRSPLEALSVGVPMEDTDVVFRCNIVTLTEEEPYAEKTILDHSSGEISTEDANILMDAVRANFNSDEISFYTGTSYRHITIWRNGKILDLAQPHDHLGQKIGQFLPREKLFRDMMEKSFDVLNNHPLNVQRAAEGKNKANSLWFWGAGTKPSLGSFKEKTGLNGVMISAVDLLKGIAVGAGMDVVEVPGATGSLDTNYEGKAEAAVKALLEDGKDFVYVHVEGPDEMGHQGSIDHKILSIEYLDSRLIALVKKAMDESGEDYRMLVLPDHPTPIRCRTHTSNPVPYVLYDSTNEQKKAAHYNEKEAAATCIFEPDGYKLMDEFLKR
ncbi:MAG: cofactor-independent phosphoglycerate mutase [Oscillospiraceae bacterium]|nr:cofactor-independent phosphoglycerate mutase [Oscillospiraceae bacterium]